MPFNRIRLEVSNGLATLTIDRPDVRNALDRATADEMSAALVQLRRDDSLRVLVITGGGDKVFVSGADIKDLKSRTIRQGLEGCNNALFAAIEAFERPVVAAINGHALGGGLELALACDIRVAVEEARFGFPEVGLGIMPGAGGTQRLPRVVGMGRAKELILTGDLIDAAEAHRIGLVNRVVPRVEFAAAVAALVDKLKSRGPMALRLAKMSLNAAARVSMDAGFQLEILAQSVLFETSDKDEGLDAFLEKRPPKFEGR
ncbi:MAG: enoyl-CoA hydratase-related protein [Candidatus Eisenbacteria bacterium]|nr:enoyl-CoA hydratase-related protein [Candidatus Eisenbacteria bacterium]